jgi:hypothetical protein
MLNDRFVLEQSAYAADRLLKTAPKARPHDRVEGAFRLILGRSPRPEEAVWSTALLERQAARSGPGAAGPGVPEKAALTHLCQVLLNTSEFVYTP